MSQVKEKDPPVFIKQIRSHPYFVNGNRHQKIRLENWIGRLEAITSNSLWRKNRDNYLKLLYVMLEMGEISGPFGGMPPRQIPKLHRHEINCYLVALDRNSNKHSHITNKALKKQPAQELWAAIQSKDSLKSEQTPAEIYKMSSLSPIMKFNNSHSRAFSDFTQKSLESFEKTIEPKLAENQNLNKFRKQQNISYFSRPKEVSRDVITEINGEKNEEIYQLLQKIYRFLSRYSQILQEDSEFESIYAELKQMSLCQQTENSKINVKNKNKLETMSIPHSKIEIKKIPTIKIDDKLQESSSHNYLHYHYFNKIIPYQQEQQQDLQKQQSLHFNPLQQPEESANISYNYQKGEYSEYSDIQFTQGISPQKLQNLNQQNQHSVVLNQLKLVNQASDISLNPQSLLKSNKFPQISYNTSSKQNTKEIKFALFNI